MKYVRLPEHNDLLVEALLEQIAAMKLEIKRLDVLRVFSEMENANLHEKLKKAKARNRK